jgi:hypothetical protein
MVRKKCLKIKKMTQSPVGAGLPANTGEARAIHRRVLLAGSHR